MACPPVKPKSRHVDCDDGHGCADATVSLTLRIMLLLHAQMLGSVEGPSICLPYARLTLKASCLRQASDGLVRWVCARR